MTPETARRVLLILTVTRWFPIGLVVGVMVLLMVERGLSVGQALTVSSFTGVVVFLLELPTSGTADAMGRKPLLVLAAVLQVAVAMLYATAQTFWAFAAAAVVSGVFRALDSGPLQAWFVDTVHQTHPGADVDRTLSRQSLVLGVSIAAGALVSAGLVWWHPVTAWSALTFPYVVYAALAVVHLVATAVLLHEEHPDAVERGLARALREARRAPRVVADGLRLARDNRVLRGLLLVEVFWAVAMVVFESLMPVRLGEVLDSTQRAGALMGVVSSVGWAVFAAGAGLAGLASGRFGVARTAMAARMLNGLGAVWMGLVAGPAALVAAYLVTYGLHGSGGPVYESLLHREASARNRSTVLSMASMLGFLSFAAAGPALGWTAEGVSTPVAMVIGGAVSVFGVFCFLPAWRREKQLRADGAVVTRV